MLLLAVSSDFQIDTLAEATIELALQGLHLFAILAELLLNSRHLTIDAFHGSG